MNESETILAQWALEQNPDASHVEVTPLRKGVWYVQVYAEGRLVEAYLSGFAPEKLDPGWKASDAPGSVAGGDL